MCGGGAGAVGSGVAGTLALPALDDLVQTLYAVCQHGAAGGQRGQRKSERAELGFAGNGGGKVAEPRYSMTAMSIFETACGASPQAVSVALAIGVGKAFKLLEALRPDWAHLSSAGTRRAGYGK